MDEGVAGTRCVLVPRHVLCAWCRRCRCGLGKAPGVGLARLACALRPHVMGQWQSGPLGKAVAPSHAAQQGRACAAVAACCSCAPKFSPPAAGYSTKRLRRSVGCGFQCGGACCCCHFAGTPKKALTSVALSPCWACALVHCPAPVGMCTAGCSCCSASSRPPSRCTTITTTGAAWWRRTAIGSDVFVGR